MARGRLPSTPSHGFGAVDVGYPRRMFRSIRSIARTGRVAAFPLTRTAVLVLAWFNRHTVMLWFRSIRDEVSRSGFDIGRMQMLLRGLWAVSADRRTTNAEALRMISIRDDGFGIEAREGWIGRATVETILGPIGPEKTTVTVA